MKCKGNNLNRRGFMHVGFLGGLGMYLMYADAPAERRALCCCCM